MDQATSIIYMGVGTGWQHPSLQDILAGKRQPTAKKLSCKLEFLENGRTQKEPGTPL